MRECYHHVYEFASDLKIMYKIMKYRSLPHDYYLPLITNSYQNYTNFYCYKYTILLP